MAELNDLVKQLPQIVPSEAYLKSLRHFQNVLLMTKIKNRLQQRGNAKQTGFRIIIKRQLFKT